MQNSFITGFELDCVLFHRSSGKGALRKHFSEFGLLTRKAMMLSGEEGRLRNRFLLPLVICTIAGEPDLIQEAVQQADIGKARPEPFL